ncbi:MAG: hypothetical protein EZS28_041400, partial [Streblomastix strix]
MNNPVSKPTTPLLAGQKVSGSQQQQQTGQSGQIMKKDQQQQKRDNQTPPQKPLKKQQATQQSGSKSKDGQQPGGSSGSDLSDRQNSDEFGEKSSSFPRDAPWPYFNCAEPCDSENNKSALLFLCGLTINQGVTDEFNGDLPLPPNTLLSSIPDVMLTALLQARVQFLITLFTHTMRRVQSSKSFSTNAVYSLQQSSQLQSGGFAPIPPIASGLIFRSQLSPLTVGSTPTLLEGSKKAPLNIRAVTAGLHSQLVGYNTINQQSLQSDQSDGSITNQITPAALWNPLIVASQVAGMKQTGSQSQTADGQPASGSGNVDQQIDTNQQQVQEDGADQTQQNQIPVEFDHIPPLPDRASAYGPNADAQFVANIQANIDAQASAGDKKGQVKKTADVTPQQKPAAAQQLIAQQQGGAKPDSAKKGLQRKDIKKVTASGSSKDGSGGQSQGGFDEIELEKDIYDGTTTPFFTNYYGTLREQVPGSVGVSAGSSSDDGQLSKLPLNYDSSDLTPFAATSYSVLKKLNISPLIGKNALSDYLFSLQTGGVTSAAQ